MTNDKRIEVLKDERRQLISAKQDLERRIDELCAEVERLRQELAIRESSEQEKVIDYLGKECVDWEDKYLALAGENARLCELAKLMHKTVSSLQDTLDASFIYNGVELSAEYFETKLNKLGIEVPS